MKKILMIAALTLAAVPMAAQETYDNANIATGDLNGTARYVGMGGAMEALGADISTIGTNPAGIGLFRHAMVNTSVSVGLLPDADNFDMGKTTKVSYDQIGFVYAHRSAENSFLNFAFNYHKSRNFQDILSVSDALHGASQNKLSYVKDALGLYDLDFGSTIIGYTNPYSQVDYLYYNSLMRDPQEDMIYYYESSNYQMKKGAKGHVGDYDFNLSGNIQDRIYLGLTFGIQHIYYKSYSEYTENILNVHDQPIGTTTLADERKIEGAGFNIKAGVILRPLETSPFRIGLYINSPTWYDLKSKNYTELFNNTPDGHSDYAVSKETYDFKLYTPWKFGASLGHTIGTSLALGATYEYSDYSTLDSRYSTGSHYSWYYDDYYEDSESDDVMNKNTEQSLKGVHTLKVGGEYKVTNELALRLGYNYVSPMYKKEGYKDGSLDSPGVFYSSSTDYINWKATDRITFGLGYNTGKVSVDLAYQYSETKGEFSPFMSFWDDPNVEPEYRLDNVSNIVDVSKKRHQILFTFGYHF